MGRQHGIGKYIVDYYCPELKLIIEIDGDVHALDERKEKDKERQKYLESLTFRMIRYSNDDILKNLNGVMTHLIYCLKMFNKTTNPSIPPLNQGEEQSKIK